MPALCLDSLSAALIIYNPDAVLKDILSRFSHQQPFSAWDLLWSFTFDHLCQLPTPFLLPTVLYWRYKKIPFIWSAVAELADWIHHHELKSLVISNMRLSNLQLIFR
ncbi:hypothetical protein AVEN_167595-1 [Araneus ventricosus]|uniref:Uncharacterized protein n=1 Tax=Araneus ventricosus TaxID=182803 RepID=A0A4Y2HT91_ARAVE|nr:hypothetical protein AVEN_167595-1 [Araneus ventricosus]